VTPEQEEQVARALAETARHEPVPPIPAEVAARLDDVLADLVTERTARDGTAAGREQTAAERAVASVDEVAARRRSRRPSWLTAAAAVALIAAAGAAVATDGFGTTSSSDSASTSAGGSSTVESPPPDAARDGAGSEAAAPESSAVRAGAPRLRTSSLAADVQRALAADVTTVPGRPGSRRKALTGPPTGTPCATPPTGPGERVLAVRLDGKPATLVLGVVRGDSRSARVYSCDDVASPMARATVLLR